MQDALRNRFGVTDVKVDIQSNWVTIRPDRSRYFSLKDLGPAIKRAGYVPSGVTIKAAGLFEETQGAMQFRIRGWPTAMPIDRGIKTPEEQEIHAKWLADGKEGRLELISP